MGTINIPRSSRCGVTFPSEELRAKTPRTPSPASRTVLRLSNNVHGFETQHDLAEPMYRVGDVLEMLQQEALHPEGLELLQFSLAVQSTIVRVGLALLGRVPSSRRRVQVYTPSDPGQTFGAASRVSAELSWPSR